MTKKNSIKVGMAWYFFSKDMKCGHEPYIKMILETKVKSLYYNGKFSRKNVKRK
jgi:hypothetical protein